MIDRLLSHRNAQQYSRSFQCTDDDCEDIEDMSIPTNDFIADPISAVLRRTVSSYS
jgi:hypothetical protein